MPDEGTSLFMVTPTPEPGFRVFKCGAEEKRDPGSSPG